MRLKTLAIGALVIVLGVVLLQISHRVQEQQLKLTRLEGQLRAEREAMRVLEAEWAFLNNPERLEHLAKEYLGLSAPLSSDIVEDVRALPALREGVQLQEVSTGQSSRVFVKPRPKPVRKVKQRGFDQLLREVAP